MLPKHKFAKNSSNFKTIPTPHLEVEDEYQEDQFDEDSSSVVIQQLNSSQGGDSKQGNRRRNNQGPFKKKN